MIRLIDVFVAFFGLFLGAPLLSILWLIGWLETGEPLFRQERVGQHLQLFVLVKFRTMRRGTASVATHLVDSAALTFFGRFLRSTKLDELPQLWNVLKGDMSLVGPRPCLLNQKEVIEARHQLGVFAVRPGITGLAQINHVDMSTPELLAETDAHMISTLTSSKYFKDIIKTVVGYGGGDRVLH
jgi:lipopolysaccharide/colanic/teichoic acid biosynthesis glycosyltransferase